MNHLGTVQTVLVIIALLLVCIWLGQEVGLLNG